MDKKKTIFLFWIGDINRIKPKLTKLADLGFNVHLGPSDTEHKALMEYPFYKNSFEMKNWAFCSDVWRVYMLSQNSGLYMDASAIAGPNLDSYINTFKNSETHLWRGMDSMIGNSFLWSGIKNNSFFQGLLEEYKTMNLNPFFYLTGPMLLTRYSITKGIPTTSFEPYNNNSGITVDTREKTRDVNSMCYKGTGSWLKKKESANEIEERERLIDEKWAAKGINKHLRKLMDDTRGNPLNVIAIRNIYENSTSNKEITECLEAYKIISKSTSLSQKMIWSKLYRVFTKR